ncbi:MAG: sn-glycerol-3-phosphate ABC transporter ATP-binding protein UgpC [Candidatus Omnitrophica bacterium]|nr:sn-glycerol-3-phosphate ABC transporter ATP-binding protein UgpC [Candidatus Omnitrophota bacterium]
MAEVRLEKVTKRFSDDVEAVRAIDLKVSDREFVVLVGPSGCGKTTTLRMVAGLEEVSAGDIYIGGRRVNDVAPKEREIAMVFQNYALYPHMSVYENMAFGLKLRRYPKAEIRKRVEEAAVILGLEKMLDRRPKALSGGQRQRVALGRAIVRKPQVFLFDEPLSNLDAKLRVQMRAEIIKLHSRLQSTMFYVTHDQVEAISMGDRIVVMHEGQIQQNDDPISIYDKPVNRFVAGFIGSPPMNFMKGRVRGANGSFYFDEGNFKVKILDNMHERIAPYREKDVIFGIRPEDIYDKLSVTEVSEDNTLSATVEVSEPMGAETYLHLSTGKHLFVARFPAHERAAPNQDLTVVFDMSKAHFFDCTTDLTII